MNVLRAPLFLIAKDTIIMFCHIKSKIMSIYRKDYHYRIGTYIIRTKWGNRIKRKYIYISKQNSEIVNSVNIQNDLFYFSLPSNDINFQLVQEVSPYMLGFQTYVFPNIQGFLKYEYNN